MIERWPFEKVNVDEILAYSRTRDEHVSLLKQFLTQIREHNLTMNSNNCFSCEKINNSWKSFISSGN